MTYDDFIKNETSLTRDEEVFGRKIWEALQGDGEPVAYMTDEDSDVSFKGAICNYDEIKNDKELQKVYSIPLFTYQPDQLSKIKELEDLNDLHIRSTLATVEELTKQVKDLTVENECLSASCNALTENLKAHQQALDAYIKEI